jgi:magnesium-transporting ATPase (P-type)
MVDDQQVRYYALSVEEALAELKTTEEGLTPGEVSRRLQAYGPNELELRARGPLARFLLQFHNPLLYVLMVAAVVAFGLGKHLDSWVILAVVLATAIIGFIQEGKAEGAIGALRRMMVPQCRVLRNGEARTTATRDLVPGDVVLLEAGDRVPADLRLIAGKNLALDEALLTGESVPTGKRFEPHDHHGRLPLGDQRNMAFSGTFVARGVGRGVVTATGPRTEMGKISGLITGTQKSTPPILKKIGEFTKAIMIGIFALSAVNFALGLHLGYELGYIFLASVGMVVAMVPEGLPAALIAAFSLGVTAMARRNALIRRLPAVETLGCATVICSDKTGTLTRNEMTVREVFAGGRSYVITGVGYEPRGEFKDEDENLIAWPEKQAPDLFETLRAGYLCNNAVLNQPGAEGGGGNAANSGNGAYGITGDPTEGALVVAALKAGINGRDERLDEIPFDSELQYMAVLVRASSRENIIYVKGSPERVVAMCASQLEDGITTDLAARRIVAEVDNMAADAMRVLGMAQKYVPGHVTSITTDDLTGMVFLGLQGMIDPPREEAAAAVKDCLRAGIRVVMITGDHAHTARVIATQLQIGLGEERTVTGSEIEVMSDDQLYAVTESVSVYARAAPEHKYRIVQQLKRRGHVVAVTGDGVNDAPALSAADIGIAMGITGTQVSKETSDMVLADDNFASIVRAVEEGRHTFNNIWKVILFLLPTNGGQGLAVLGAVLLAPLVPVFALRLPVEPVQILWVNLVMAVACAIPLSHEPKERRILDRPPRDPAAALVNRLFILKVAVVSVVSAGAALTMFLLYVNGAGDHPSGAVLAQAQTVAFTTIVMVQLAYLGTARWVTASAFTMSPFSNRWLLAGASFTLGLQLLIVYSKPLLGFSPFRTLPFPAEWWVYIALAATPGFLAVELEKLVRRRLKSGRLAE